MRKKCTCALCSCPKRYETFSFLHGEDVLEKLGCRPVAAKDIMLKPALLKK